MTRGSILVAGVLLVTATAFSCGSSGGDGTGGAGTGGGAGSTGSTGGGGGGGGSTGAAGTTGGATGGGGSSGAFMAVPPCNSAVNYVSGQSSIAFGMLGGAVAYDPKCLKVPAGTEVTFTGDFSMHPLEPSGNRGTTTGNPIVPTASGNSKAFTFAAPGFYAYFCETHAPSDNGTSMSGVIWVE